MTAGVFVTAFYSFRMFFLVFHGEERFRNKPFPPERDEPEPELEEDDAHGDHGAHGARARAPRTTRTRTTTTRMAHDGHGHDDHGHAHEPHESPLGRDAAAGAAGDPVGRHRLHDDQADAVRQLLRQLDLLQQPRSIRRWKSSPRTSTARREMALHALRRAAVLAGARRRACCRTSCTSSSRRWPTRPRKIFAPITKILENKYYFDWFNENVLAAGARLLGRGLWKGGDQGLIDGLFVNGSARLVGAIAGVVRLVQTGHLYWYALVMILGVFGLMTWQLWPYFQTHRSLINAGGEQE